VPDTGAAGAVPRGSTSSGAVLQASTSGPEETRALAGAVAALVDDGDLLVLTGDLGAGKTCFTQGLGRALGVTDRITSPTFTIVAEHEGRLALHHLDAYRLAGPEEAADLDLPDLLERGVTVIEWGDRLEGALPVDRLRIELRLGAGDDDRLLRFEPVGERWSSRAAALAGAVAPWSGAC
jgi:tRNA threonylcarbamoyladenosine biosynthesis protein TsaE